MNKSLNSLIVILFGAAVVLGSNTFYIVDETQQAVITQFGEPIGTPITQAGLHVKTPFIQNVNYFEKRILEWDGDPNQIPTRDKRYIWVDATARWKIVDALKFMQSVGNEAGAQTRMDDIVDANARDVISNANSIEVVRDTNRLVEDAKALEGTDETDWEAVIGTHERVETGREKLTREILRRSREILPNYGIELIDVQIKRINYVQEVRKKVYERMISERKRAAERFRSEGQGEKAGIEGQTVKEMEQIQSEAYRKAQEVRGKADAEATAIYAEAYNKDPEFYSFIKTLETYRTTVSPSTTLFLSTDNELYQYLQGIQPRKNFP